MKGRIEGSPSPNGSPARYGAHAAGAAQMMLDPTASHRPAWFLGWGRPGMLSGVGRGTPIQIPQSSNAQVCSVPISAAEIPRISTPASQPEAEPNEAPPHYPHGSLRRKLWLAAIPGENAIGARSRKGVFSAPVASTEGHEACVPTRGMGNGANIHATAAGSDTGFGDFCGYTASKWRQMASNPAVGTYSSSICKRLITSN